MLSVFRIQSRDSSGRFTTYQPLSPETVPPRTLTKEFSVGSDNGNGDYKVMMIERVSYTCTCPDHRFRQRDCKHIRQIQTL